MKTKIKWKVSEEPTGRYRSFEKRMWPSADYCDKEQNPAAQIYCYNQDGSSVSYIPRKAKAGDHPPLILYVADHSNKPNWQWRKVKGTFATISEAKKKFLEILKNFPHIKPDENN